MRRSITSIALTAGAVPDRPRGPRRRTGNHRARCDRRSLHRCADRRLPAQRSAERGGFTFYGSGYGHGLGMSQWGSYGLALQGWGYRKILANFYRGTEVQADPNPVKKLRVGLTYDRSVIHLGARSGPVKLWVGATARQRGGHDPRRQDVDGQGDPHRLSPFATAPASWSAANGGAAPRSICSPPTPTQARKVFVPEADAVSGVGYAYKRSYLEFNLYRTGGAWRERVILPIALEQYLYGIGEMPSSWPKQALQTQAVASRTFATHTVRTYDPRSYCNCDITDGANDQVYIGDNKESGAIGQALGARRRRHPQAHRHPQRQGHPVGVRCLGRRSFRQRRGCLARGRPRVRDPLPQGRMRSRARTPPPTPGPTGSEPSPRPNSRIGSLPTPAASARCRGSRRSSAGSGGRVITAIVKGASGSAG